MLDSFLNFTFETITNYYYVHIFTDILVRYLGREVMNKWIPSQTSPLICHDQFAHKGLINFLIRRKLFKVSQWELHTYE